MGEEEIEKLRGVVRDCLSKHLYSSAIFFADKVAAFTSDPADIYMQAQALFLGHHYRRAFHLLNASQIVLRDLRFRYLAAKCLVLSPISTYFSLQFSLSRAYTKCGVKIRVFQLQLDVYITCIAILLFILFVFSLASTLIQSPVC